MQIAFRNTFYLFFMNLENILLEYENNFNKIKESYDVIIK